MKKSIFTLVVMILVSSFNLAYGATKLSKSQWQEDLKVYAEQLELNHLNLYHTKARAEFKQSLRTLENVLPELSDNQITVALMKITRTVNDGHTSFPLWGPTVHKFPFKLIQLQNKLYVLETSTKHAAILGAELIAINGFSIDEIKNTIANIVPFSENQYSRSIRTAQYLPVAEVLNGLGFVNDDYEAELTFVKKGKTLQVNLEAIKQPQLQKALFISSPVENSKVTSVSDGLWFSSSQDKKSVYLHFERYTDVASMEEFSRKLLKFINDNLSNNLIIDLRNNYGGDFFAGLRLAQALVLADSLDWHSGIYVLTNNVTFSAAMSNTAQFKQLLNAKLVGQPTGAKPKGYQDMGEFTLPNSKRVVTYSKRFYDFLGRDDTAIFPDVTIELSIEDYINAKDRQLEWILKQVNWH